jgi:hypothetical protein
MSITLAGKQRIINGTMMVSRLVKILGVVVALGSVGGCKVAVMVPDGGDVTSGTGTRNCASGVLCEFDVVDRTFSDSFTAKAKPGYKFVKWKAGPGFLCGNSGNAMCIVDNTKATANIAPAFDAVIAGQSVFYAMPVFERIDSTGYANFKIGADGYLIKPDTEPHPVGKSGVLAKATVGSRERLGIFGQAITRARYPVDDTSPEGKPSMASILLR